MASCVFIVVNIVYRKQTRCLIIITPNMSPAPVPAEAVDISMRRACCLPHMSCCMWYRR